MRLEQRDKEFTAIGASIGANCRPCIEHHIEAARAAGLSEAEVGVSVTTARAVRDQAIAMAEEVQQRVAEITAKRATTMLDELDGMARPAARRAKALEEVRL